MLTDNKKAHYSQMIKHEAMRLGFMACGISKAEFLEMEAPRLEEYLNNHRNGEMAYLENYFDKRLDPRLLVDDAKSVISLTYNYFSDKKQNDQEAPKISKYAYGTDYHFVLKDKLKDLLKFIQENIGEINGRCFVDSAPVMDKAWAQRAGLGWQGKHTLLINKNKGSFFFVSELIIDLELEYDTPFPTDHCGTCTRCIDACPTDAIIAPYKVDGSRCISYLTIELKDQIPEEFKGKMDNWMFGCDICQDVCPWNKFSIINTEDKFQPSEDLLNLTKKDLIELTEETFRVIFKNSPVKRTKYSGLTRNINFLVSNPTKKIN